MVIRRQPSIDGVCDHFLPSNPATHGQGYGIGRRSVIRFQPLAVATLARRFWRRWPRLTRSAWWSSRASWAGSGRASQARRLPRARRGLAQWQGGGSLAAHQKSVGYRDPLPGCPNRIAGHPDAADGASTAPGTRAVLRSQARDPTRCLDPTNRLSAGCCCAIIPIDGLGGAGSGGRTGRGPGTGDGTTIQSGALPVVGCAGA